MGTVDQNPMCNRGALMHVTLANSALPLNLVATMAITSPHVGTAMQCMLKRVAANIEGWNAQTLQ